MGSFRALLLTEAHQKMTPRSISWILIFLRLSRLLPNPAFLQLIPNTLQVKDYLNILLLVLKNL